MALSKAFTTVTPFSKLLGLLMFVGFPFLGFYMGMQFQKSITPAYPSLQYEAPQRLRVEEPSPVPSKPKSNTYVCPQDAKMCPDGTYVHRFGPKCGFETCPLAK